MIDNQCSETTTTIPVITYRGVGVSYEMANTAAIQAHIEGLTISQGEGIGEPFKLLPWERRFIRGAFASDIDQACLSMARGGGKSSFVAAIAKCALDGPLSVPRGECIVVASSFSQSRIIFEHVLAFIGDVDPSVWRVQNTTNQASIEHRETGARVRCIGSDPARAMGLAPALVIEDEPASWPASTAMDMHVALTSALGKVPNSRLISIGTLPSGADHFFVAMSKEPGTYAQIHQARPDDPIYHKTTWRRANPSLEHMPNLMRAYEKDAARAKISPQHLQSFRALRLNQGVEQTQRQLLIDPATWTKHAEIDGVPERRGDCVWSLDLGSGNAMSACAAYWPESGALECFAAFPLEPDLSERGKRDGVTNEYLRMFRRGELITVGQHVTDIRALLHEALARFGQPVRIVCDRWRQGELREALSGSLLRRCELEFRGQGFRDQSEDVRVFRRAVVEGRVKSTKSLLLRSAFRECVTVADPAANEKIAKQSHGGRRKRSKDDSAVATIMVVSSGIREAPRKRGVRAWSVA